MEVFLETDRLLLRRFTRDDVDNLVELDSDPEVMRFLTGGAATPREVVERQILPAFLRYYEQSDHYGFWAAVEKSTGEFLGWLHFRPGEGAPADEPELGYRLRRAAWGKGYATEASRALIRMGFTKLEVRRVVASTYEHNVASRKVMEKIGMRLVRTFRPTPEELMSHGLDPETAYELFPDNDVEYALDRTEWEQREGRPQS